MAPTSKEPAPTLQPAANMQIACSGEPSANATKSQPESDSEPPRPLTMSDLDLDASYVGLFELSPQEPRFQSPHTWQQPVTPYPPGWTAAGVDKDLKNQKALLERHCGQVGENNAPNHVREEIALCEKQLAERMELEAKYPGLKWRTIVWIEERKREVTLLAEKGDPNEMVPSLEAVIAAYESGQLDVYPGEDLVTYWYKGKQISQPRPFEFE